VLTPDVPTVAELAPELDVSLWNGLFVHKDTPADVREKIIAVAKKTIASEKAMTFAEETGAQLYWQDAAASAEQITQDINTLNAIDALLAE